MPRDKKKLRYFRVIILLYRLSLVELHLISYFTVIVSSKCTLSYFTLKIIFNFVFIYKKEI